MTKAEQQRRLLLAYLMHDVRMMYFYCAMRNPMGESERLVLLERFPSARICGCRGTRTGAQLSIDSQSMRTECETTGARERRRIGRGRGAE